MTACRGCGAPLPAPFYTVRGVPVHSCLLVDDRDQALSYPQGDVELALCHTCGLVQNSAFDESRVDYGADYEDSQAHSPRFMAFAEGLVADLSQRYDLRGRRVLEIGCGKGDFLTLLVNHSGASGIGFDPAYSPGPVRADEPSALTFVRERYDERHAGEAADLVCCRHTLEHVADVEGFLAVLRRNLDGHPDTAVFFELPDLSRILAEDAFWDIYYEHCSYFTAATLERRFTHAGFNVQQVKLAFEGQYLLLEATPSAVPHPARDNEDDRAVMEVEDMVAGFRNRVARRIRSLREQLDRAAERRERVVLWGAGSKAVGYLTTLDVADEVAGVVDINPRKQGRYLAGTGHAILSPDDLRALRPDIVIVMNPAYIDEVRGDLARMGVSPRLEAL